MVKQIKKKKMTKGLGLTEEEESDEALMCRIRRGQLLGQRSRRAKGTEQEKDRQGRGSPWRELQKFLQRIELHKHVVLRAKLEINVFLRFKRQYDESDSVERYLAKARGALSLPALDEAYQHAWADGRSSVLRIERLKFIIKEDMD